MDNDPDSRPPCRLLHIVEGGDYGYRFRNGRKGLHPFTAWNGELPGTLPMVAGTGEAPSGVSPTSRTACPRTIAAHLLVTSWGDHRIERFRLQPRGASFQAIGRSRSSSAARTSAPSASRSRPTARSSSATGSTSRTSCTARAASGGSAASSRRSESKPAANHLACHPAIPGKVSLAARPLRERAARELAGKDDAGRAFLQLRRGSCPTRASGPLPWPRS